MIRVNKYIIIVLLFVLVSCAEKKQEPFSFVQLCDTQLGFGGYEHDLRALKMAVKQINTLNPDFVVICGDLVNTPNESSFSDYNETIGGFKMPCYSVPGNHDVGNIPNDTTLSYYRKTMGEDYYKFEKNGYSFIVTNSQLWQSNVENESKIHDAWFKKTIREEGVLNKPVFVIGHHPLYEDSVEEESAYFNLPLTKRKEILSLFKQNNVKAYLFGHAHKTIINKYENIELISGGTTSKNFDKTPLGFRVWKVSLDTIAQHFVELESTSMEKTEIGHN
jgi:predicted phosphodiesterase